MSDRLPERCKFCGDWYITAYCPRCVRGKTTMSDHPNWWCGWRQHWRATPCVCPQFDPSSGCGRVEVTDE